jgi:hypothetical protein
MAENPLSGKKDQSAAREIREEVNEQLEQAHTAPTVRNPNRDRARGDWDRTQRHHDPGADRSKDRDAV